MKFISKIQMLKRGFLLIFTCILFINAYSQSANQKSDQELVKAAIEDYVLGLYEVSPNRIARSVDTTLHKIGYYDYHGEAYHHVPMTYKHLYDLAGTWNKSGKEANADSPQRIEIYEVNDRTASAKLTAVWGIDFMHLSKVDGRWKIMNIMWQSPPK